VHVIVLPGGGIGPLMLSLLLGCAFLSRQLWGRMTARQRSTAGGGWSRPGAPAR
jgi:hypothetical protein